MKANFSSIFGWPVKNTSQSKGSHKGHKGHKGHKVYTTIRSLTAQRSERKQYAPTPFSYGRIYKIDIAIFTCLSDRSLNAILLVKFVNHQNYIVKFLVMQKTFYKFVIHTK